MTSLLLILGVFVYKHRLVLSYALKMLHIKTKALSSSCGPHVNTARENGLHVEHQCTGRGSEWLGERTRLRNSRPVQLAQD